MVKSVGGDITEKGDSIIIHGKPHLFGGVCDSFNDHRIAMSLAVASVVCKNLFVIENSQAVNKSYPTFFEDLRVLGGRIETED